jgi:tetratricopeptide (TPR) repeat protein
MCIHKQVEFFQRSTLNILMEMTKSSERFNARLKGHLPEAEDYFQRSYVDSPGNFSAARELASIHLVRGDLESAERFAREAFQSAQDNPYVLDILLSILLKKRNKDTGLASEIATLFDKLENVGEEQGHSFYTTRRAEFEWKFGQVSEACKLIDSAALKTPHIFNVRALRSEIYLDSGNKAIAWDEIKKLQNNVYRESGGERRSNLRQLLQLEASYYLSIGKFNEAKEVYRTKNVFTEKETSDFVKSVETEQAFRKK